MNSIAVRAEQAETVPFWARPAGVVFFCALWAGGFAFIAIALRSGVFRDDAVEIYKTQSLQLFYASRNPSLYDWLLYGVNTIVRDPAISASMLNYGLMLACALLFYRLARRVIEDERLQALSVYSLSLLSVFGYDSHHQITHTNVTIVIVAATLLSLHSLAAERSLRTYVSLGVLIALGLMSKYAYGIVFGALLLAALFERRYRAVILDRGFLVSLVAGLVPLAILAAILSGQTQGVASTVGYLVQSFRQEAFLPKLQVLIGETLTYVMPFVAVFALAFMVPFPPRREGAGKDADFMRLNLTVFVLGAVIMAAWVFGLDSTRLRARYLHGIWLAVPLVAFMALERRALRPFAIRAYLSMTAIIATAVFGIFLAGCLAPSVALCRKCDQSVPYRQLGRAIEARYGPSPTLVGLAPSDAGRLRVAVPGARTVPLEDSEYRPPAASFAVCLLAWSPDAGREAEIAAALAQHGLDLSADEELVIDWWAPLLADGRQTTFRIQRLPQGSPVCA